MLHRSIGSYRLIVGLGAVALAVLLFAVGAGAATNPGLGAADPYAVLGGSTVTNTGTTTICGDLGVSPGTAITGGPTMTCGGTTHSADASAANAQLAVTTAYNNLAAQPCTTTISALGGLVLTPGVYCSASSAGLTGTLTLDAGGNANAVWIFQMGSTLTTASGSTVQVINGGQNCNVFWQVGSSATIGTTTTFVGNILALTSITLNTGATVSGRALARNGAVTMDTNTVTRSSCVTSTPTASPVPTPPYPTPNPSAVGGIAALTVSSSGSSVPWVLLAAVAAGLMAVMGAGLWYSKRRSLR
jgi:Ice-binding-like